MLASLLFVALCVSCSASHEIARERTKDTNVAPISHENDAGTNFDQNGSIAAKDFKVNLIANASRVCSGECITLMADALEGVTPYNFKWSPNIGAGPGPHEVCPTRTSRYEVVVTDALAGTEEFASRPVRASIEIGFDSTCLDAALITDANMKEDPTVDLDGSKPQFDSGPQEPTQVVPLCRETTLSAGNSHTCAMKTDGTLFCWGENTHGQLGNDSFSYSPKPVQEHMAASDWATVSAGRLHTCTIKTDGTLFCWGGGFQGQLGNNSTSNSPVPVQEYTAASDWTTVSAGMYDYSCAVKTDDTLFCWGGNGLNQLGNYSTITPTQTSPAPMQEYTAASDWATVSAGDSHTCAVKTDGTLYCWGSNIFGQLGNNSTLPRMEPIQEYTAANDWATVSAGDAYTCAIKIDGTLFCWGENNGGNLGNNSYSESLVPVRENTAASDWATVSTGHSHTCAVKTDGTLFCWGSSDSGQLGNNSTSDSLVPMQEYTAATDWATVSNGYNHTCAVKTDGTLFCWGNSRAIGYNSESASLVPVQENTAATDWAFVPAVDAHACAVKAIRLSSLDKTD